MIKLLDGVTFLHSLRTESAIVFDVKCFSFNMVRTTIFVLHFVRPKVKQVKFTTWYKINAKYTPHTVVSLKPLSKGILLTAQGTLGTSSGGGNLPPETIEIHV